MLAGILLALFVALHSRAENEPIPDLGDRTADGFVVRCYWIGVFDSISRFGRQGLHGSFGGAGSSLNGEQKTHATFILTQEVDDHGKIRVTTRAAHWSSEVSHLHYWSGDGERPKAGTGGSGGGEISPADMSVQVVEGDGRVKIYVGFSLQPRGYSFDVRYHPLESPDILTVRVSAKEEIKRWEAGVSGFTADEPVNPKSRKLLIRQEFGDPGAKSDFYEKWVVTRVCEPANVHLVAPRGTKRQYTFSGAHPEVLDFISAQPGVLEILFIAAATPSSAGILQKIQDRVRFKIEGIGNSKMEWDAANPGGKAIVEGKFLTAKLKFIGLPEKNDDFGRKKVELLVDGNPVESASVKVFFPRDARNHPGGQSDSPNWFYYYLQTVPKLGPKPNIKYSILHSSQFDPNVDEIYIDDGSIKPYTPPYGAYGTLYGIDTFAWCLTHEMQHYKDFVDFWDIDNVGLTKWRIGQGKTGPDDDHDGDDIPNRVEDVNLNGAYDPGDLYDWKNPRTPTAGRPGNILNDFEDWNCKRHSTMKGDHAKDWADPGMQHLTLDKWAD